MKTMQTIREDLREIRYYYAKQKMFDNASKTIVTCSVAEKVSRYNQVVKYAPARLFDLYISLYVQNNTQEALAFDWNFSTAYIKQLNKKLCEFLYEKMFVD